jgi:sec-independent protein translocase protein TatA
MTFADPIQILIIGVVAVAILLWGPSKIPQLARSIGRARREFELGSKESGDSTPGPSVGSGTDDALINTAKQLGVTTEGKTRDEISNEIVQRVKKFA